MCALTYHAGRRIQGTSADAVSGGWKELARTTLGSGNTNINVTSIPDKRYYMILRNTLGRSGGGSNGGYQFNGDSGSNYAVRRSGQGGNFGTDANFSDLDLWDANSPQILGVDYLVNKSDKEKLLLSHVNDSNTAGAGNAPNRAVILGKWANTSDAINRIDLNSMNSTTWNSGSEVVVLGWDPADTHTTNFWEELASVELGSAGASLSSGTITAKKYLWVQVFFEHLGGSNPNTLWRFNSDSGNNYANRSSHDGGSEDVETGISHLDFYGQTNDSNGFINMFIINNASNEKLVIGHTILAGASGAGNAPSRDEHVVKWANTSNQITNITSTSTNGNNYGGKSFIKVWGSD
jgi:hypothetical protein